jgi:hypothetical protein
MDKIHLANEKLVPQTPLFFTRTWIPRGTLRRLAAKQRHRLLQFNVLRVGLTATQDPSITCEPNNRTSQSIHEQSQSPMFVNKHD